MGNGTTSSFSYQTEQGLGRFSSLTKAIAAGGKILKICSLPLTIRREWVKVEKGYSQQARIRKERNTRITTACNLKVHISHP